jgi:hypothetical protein
MFRNFVAQVKKRGEMPCDVADVWEQCVHMTTMERWHVIGHTLKNYIAEVIKLIEQQRSASGHTNLTKIKPEEMTEKEQKKIASLVLVRSSRFQRAQKLRKYYTDELSQHLHETCIFIKEVEGTGDPFARGSLFYTYSWEMVLFGQKMLILIIAMSSPPDADIVVMAGAMFFMLFVLIMGVSNHPHTWQTLNDLEMWMDCLTLYLVVFALIGWNTLVIITAYLINVVTLLPVLLRACLPVFPDEVEPDAAFKKPKKAETVQVVTEKSEETLGKAQLAFYSAALGVNGNKSLIKFQKRMKKFVERVHARKKLLAEREALGEETDQLLASGLADERPEGDIAKRPPPGLSRRTYDV